MSVASHVMVASTALLITATVIGAVVASLDEGSGTQEDEPEGEQE